MGARRWGQMERGRGWKGRNGRKRGREKGEGKGGGREGGRREGGEGRCGRGVEVGETVAGGGLGEMERWGKERMVSTRKSRFNRKEKRRTRKNSGGIPLGPSKVTGQKTVEEHHRKVPEGTRIPYQKQ